MMQALAAAVDLAGVGKFAQHAIERGAVGVLGAESARDLAGADLAATLADEGCKLLAGGQAGVFHRLFFGQFFGPLMKPNPAARLR
jgi:hypothetical protein